MFAVVNINSRITVTAIEETINKTILKMEVGDIVNRKNNENWGKLNGHMIQGHVDQIGQCTC